MEHIAINRLVCVAALVCLAHIAEADQLQFKMQANGGTTYASFASVQLLDAQGKVQFRGDADRFGRIEAAAAPGNYRASVTIRGQTKTANVRLTGGNGLQVVTLN